VLAVMVLGSAIWLGAILVSWSQKLARLQASLAARSDDREALPLTGERELDRLVDALNAAGKRVGEERRRASAAERLAAVGRFAAAKGVTVEAAAIPEAPTPPDFDIDQVRRALDNLILNAVQNTPRGGTVTVAAAETNGNLHLRVSDTGPGVAGDIRERLFEPFVTARAEGTG